MDDIDRIVKTTLISTTQIVSKITSPSYGLITVKTILSRILADHPILRHVHIDPSVKGMSKSITVDSQINNEDMAAVGNAIQALIHNVESLTGDMSFKKDLRLYLSPHLDALENMGVVL